MANWLMTNDQKSFDLESAFEELEYIYWTKNNNKINEGDIVYIYVTAPTAQVMYQLKVVDFADNSVNTSAQAKFWIQEDQDQEYTGQFIVLQGMKKVDKETLSLRVLKGLGFMPIKEKIDSDITRIVKNEEIKKREEEIKAIDEYLREPSRENINKLKEMKISAKRVDMERKKKNQTPAERLTKKQKYEYSKLDDVM